MALNHVADFFHPKTIPTRDMEKVLLLIPISKFIKSSTISKDIVESFGFSMATIFY